MRYTEEKTRAGEYLRLALNYLSKHNLPVDPANYTVWYEYVSGKNLKLKKAMDLSLKNPSSLDNTQIKKLYHKYITGHDRVVISKLLIQVSLMLKDIIGHVSDTGDDLTGHGSNLGDLAAQIHEARDYQEIKSIVDQMIAETKELVDSGKRLQNRMRMSAQDLKQLQKDLAKSQQEAQTDALTHLINRRGLETKLEMEKDWARQNHSPLSIIMLDIDHFKKINDTFGHLVGDSLLRSIAHLLKTHLRKNDIPSRYGGEEFLILLPETQIFEAVAVGKKIMQALAKKEWKLKKTRESMGNITVSMGVALFRHDALNESFIKRADAALYQAKKEGRNRIITEEIV